MKEVKHVHDRSCKFLNARKYLYFRVFVYVNKQVDRHDCESLSRVKTAVFSFDFYADAR